MKIKPLFALLVILSFSALAFAQDESDKYPAVVLPENVMREVVRRILVWKFKPAKKSKTIYLASEGIARAWLPAIRNIEFRLLSEDEAINNKTDIYFFSKPNLSKKTYQIGLEFGTRGCYGTEENWFFRISKNRVRLWLSTGGLGGGCGNAVFEAPGKSNTFPNELKGCEFFDKGRFPTS
jgi:hypothetical protein